MLCCVPSALWRRRRRPQETQDEGLAESQEQPDDRPTEPRGTPEPCTNKDQEDSQTQDSPKRRSFYSWSRFKKKVLHRPRVKNVFGRLRRRTSTNRSLEDDQFGPTSDRSCAGFLPPLQTSGSLGIPPQTYANPWDLEYRPNPVFFPHLQPGNDGGGQPKSGKMNSGPEVTTPTIDMGANPNYWDSPIDEKPTTEPIVCDECGAIFSTPGQRNTHVARKHIRRFVCSLPDCAASFHLNADLQRHRRTVHRDQLDTDSDHAEQWKCTNSYCKTPNLVFTRRDNFQRHLSRCRRSQT